MANVSLLVGSIKSLDKRKKYSNILSAVGHVSTQRNLDS